MGKTELGRPCAGLQRPMRPPPWLPLCVSLYGVAAVESGSCKPFCEKKTQSWESLCTWNGCDGCSECYVQPPPASPPQCQGFCEAKTQPWDTRCSWAGCGGCTECGAESECKPFCEDKTQAWDDKCTWEGCKGCTECSLRAPVCSRFVKTRRKTGITSAPGSDMLPICCRGAIGCS